MSLFYVVYKPTHSTMHSITGDQVNAASTPLHHACQLSGLLEQCRPWPRGCSVACASNLWYVSILLCRAHGAQY